MQELLDHLIGFTAAQHVRHSNGEKCKFRKSRYFSNGSLSPIIYGTALAEYVATKKGSILHVEITSIEGYPIKSKNAKSNLKRFVEDIMGHLKNDLVEGSPEWNNYTMKQIQQEPNPNLQSYENNHGERVEIWNAEDIERLKIIITEPILV